MYGIPENPGVVTYSWLRAWWLRSVWGYDVVQVRRSPRMSCFGGLAYDERYLMSPKNKSR